MKKISYKGQLVTIREAATLSGIPYDSIVKRVRQGLPENILFQPPEEKWKHWWVLNVLIREGSNQQRKEVEDTIINFLAEQKKKANKEKYKYVRALIRLSQILHARDKRISIVRKAATRLKDKKDTGKIPAVCTFAGTD